MIKNIIFDWSGVVNNNFAQSCEAVNYVLRHFNVPAMTLEEIKADWIQPYMLFYSARIPHLDIEKEKELFYLSYNEAIKTTPNTAFAGMPEMLKLFQAAGLNMIIISSDHPGTLADDLDKFGLNGVFNEVFADVHDKRVGLQDIMTKHNFKNSETVFIGDSTHEVESGQSANMLTCAVTWGFQNKDKLLAARPDFLAESVAELKNIILHRHAPATNVLGVRVSLLDQTTALRIASNYLKSNYQYHIFTPNPEMLVKAASDHYFRDILNTGNLNLCDGFGLWLALKLSSFKLSFRPESGQSPDGVEKSSARITGVDFMFDLCALAARENKKIFLLGSGNREVASKTKDALQSKFPKLNIIGVHPWLTITEDVVTGKLILNELENTRLLEEIKSASPDILFVAFGMGKQEKWIHEYATQIPSLKIAMGVGGAFDYISGKIPRAPRLMRKVGLEWLYRLIREPRRAGRIFNATIKFLYYVGKGSGK
ncbi:MAG: WecB/TagA/CpsF family glycosyltransferase [Candidatus Magasanikbacteria bacterium]|nr:WecB/TagA/CpsF family glycosyltransferase [Candidatus Magasanikbacteria bacterium]